ncbi:microfibril-associated glycoprotein 4-like [Drosophila ananassae]|uniref:microfibril-associated glycoprotein 4-like n=1 Tax=Drosophila ananassae TaxID=7217 RepID=UPI001CFFF69C|nr:microfibril-associated glycoprotein 4-like [Drosophila ananassae]
MILSAVFLFLIPVSLAVEQEPMLTPPLKTEAANTTNLPDRCPSTTDTFKFHQEIHLPGLEPFQAICFSNKDIGSGWMEVYFKIGMFFGPTEFHRTFDNYINGFNTLEGGHFIGLEKLHILTSRKPHEALVFNYKDTRYKVKCDNFVMGDRSEGYSLKQLDGCVGDTRVLNLIQGTKFSTFDHDRDGNPDHNWAEETDHGFWFSSGEPVLGKYLLLYFLIRRKD